MGAERLSRQDAYKSLEATMVRVTMNALFKLMEPRFHGFPNNYLVIDTETTGVDFKDDLIWQVGHCLVKDGTVADRGNFLLDWTTHPAIDQAWLRQRLIDTKQAVEYTRDGHPTGKTYHINYDRMAAEGVAPEPVLQQYLEWFKEIRESRLFFIAHNGYHFDANMLESHFRRFLKDPWAFNDWEMFDTGMVEKAAQSSLVPWAGETVRDFSRRAYAQWLRGIRWALDTHCVPKYDLVAKYGLDMSAAHDAGFDAYVTHLLFSTWREGLAPQPVSSPASVMT